MIKLSDAVHTLLASTAIIIIALLLASPHLIHLPHHVTRMYVVHEHRAQCTHIHSQCMYLNVCLNIRRCNQPSLAINDDADNPVFWLFFHYSHIRTNMIWDWDYTHSDKLGWGGSWWNNHWCSSVRICVCAYEIMERGQSDTTKYTIKYISHAHSTHSSQSDEK